MRTGSRCLESVSNGRANEPEYPPIDIRLLRTIAGDEAEEMIEDARRVLSGDYEALSANITPLRDPETGLYKLLDDSRAARIAAIAQRYWAAIASRAMPSE